MLGFADKKTKEMLRPDYRVSVEELFKRFEEVLLYGHSDLFQASNHAPTGLQHEKSLLAKELEESWQMVEHDPDAPGGLGFSLPRRGRFDLSPDYRHKNLWRPWSLRQ
jgi:hypothetical protein